MIHWLGSADDPRLDSYRHVGDPGWLQQQHLFVAEGRLVVERLLDLERYDVTSILVNRSAYDALLARLAAAEANVFVGDDDTLVRITGFNFHRGCLALVRRPAPPPRELLLQATRLLALEGVGNPDNIGGLFRTAAAFGLDGAMLSGTSGDPFYRKAVRTSMGAVLRLPFLRVDDWPGGLDELKARGFTIVALTPQAAAVPIAQFAAMTAPDARMVLLVGAEGPGLSPATLARADARVCIPIERDVDSLNVVVAAGIALERLSSRAGVENRPTV